MSDWLPILNAVAAWFGAFTGGFALVINGLNRRDAVRERRKADRAKLPWASLLRFRSEPGFLTLRVHIHNPVSATFDLREIRVVRPRRASVVMVHIPAFGVADLPVGTKSAPVTMPVMAGRASTAAATASAVADVRLALPKGGRPFRTLFPSSDPAQIVCEIALSGSTSPPMREPIRIVAKETIAL